MFQTTDKPTYVQYWGYDSHNKIQYQHWTLNRIFFGWNYHRIGGPARMWYHKNGDMYKEEWYLYGIRTENHLDWLIENGISAPYSKEDEMAIKLRWI